MPNEAVPELIDDVPTAIVNHGPVVSWERMEDMVRGGRNPQRGRRAPRPTVTDLDAGSEEDKELGQ